MRPLTLGQYLQPTLRAPAGGRVRAAGAVCRLGTAARALGFTHVASAPKVRSSYHADEAHR